MDDLLDLNWSSSTSSTSAANGSKPISPISQSVKPTASSQFDFLAKSSTSGTSGTSSPNYYNASTTPRSFTPTAQAPKPAVPSDNPPRTSAPASASPQVWNGSDAFSSLLGMGASGASGSKNMTLAQRQAQMADEKKRKDEHERQQFSGLGDWEQLGSGAGPSSTSSQHRTSPPLQPVPTKATSSFDALLQPSSRPSSSASKVSPKPPAQAVGNSNGAGWEDDDDFMVGSSSLTKTAQRPQSSPQPDDPWDFDQLAAVKPRPTLQPNGSSSRGGNSGMRTPDPNFDFGEWRDEDEEEQGRLSSSRASRDAARRRDHDRAPGRPAQTSRAASPPPHVVGQIVEMGFSPAQARQALAKTANGLDVQGALDTLLAEAFQSKAGGQGDELGEADDDYVERERIRREEEDRERRRRRRQGPSREAVKPRSAQERESDRSGTGTPIQAEQILAQASEIGQSVFTKATSLWNTGKERAMKAYEEQRKAYEAQQADARRGKAQDGRPRWMVEAEGRERGGGGDEGPAPSGFRDDDVDAGGPAVAARRKAPAPRANGNGDGPSRGPRNQPTAERYMSTKERADLLFADEPKNYVSPARHRKPAETSRPARTATPPAPLPARTLVSASPEVVQRSAAHKAKGNDHFKLGRFTEAETAYSSGIRELPDGHLHLIPLHNNRAATRLKLGESNGAAEDCTTVITLIGPAYHPSKEAPLPAEVAAEVKLADSFVKATTKRAQAWEMGEKWSKAVEDWERVLGFDTTMLGNSAATTRNLAAEGLRRSKRMLEGGDAKPATPAVAAAKRPVRTATPVTRPSNVDDSEAVATLRAAAKALEAEDQQRLQLKDSVEARLNAWKGGKETNLRALLASLDAVLWDEVLAGGLKVGMHELIAEKQVKIKYMKVIARLHPDKLDVNKTTVEQRMLANGAFGTLNEAWQAFNNA